MIPTESASKLNDKKENINTNSGQIDNTKQQLSTITNNLHKKKQNKKRYLLKKEQEVIEKKR